MAVYVYGYRYVDVGWCVSVYVGVRRVCLCILVYVDVCWCMLVCGGVRPCECNASH